MAAEQIAQNTTLIQPGISFRDLVERSASLPATVSRRATACSITASGWPTNTRRCRMPATGRDDMPDGVLEPGMVLCVESYIGRLGGHEGVKIEEQILITETGNEQLSTYPLDERLLAAELPMRSASRIGAATIFSGVVLAVMNGRPLRRPVQPTTITSARCRLEALRQRPASAVDGRDIRPALGNGDDRGAMAAALAALGKDVRGLRPPLPDRASGAMKPDIESRPL